MFLYVCIHSQGTTLQDDSHRPDIYRAELKEDLCGKLGMVISGGSSPTDHVELSQIDLFILAAHSTPGPLYHLGGRWTQVSMVEWLMTGNRQEQQL